MAQFGQIIEKRRVQRDVQWTRGTLLTLMGDPFSAGFLAEAMTITPPSARSRSLRHRGFGLSAFYPRELSLKSLTAVASMVGMAIVHRPDVYGRWRYINRRRWGVIDRRWRGDVYRLRCNRAANQSSNTESQ